jgi:cytochrome c oxidase cbb3-type subunit III
MTRRRSRSFCPIVVAVASILNIGCQEEQKHLHTTPPVSVRWVHQTELEPGPLIPERRPRGVQNPFEGNAHATGEGKKLYHYFNCSGCHANGGGAIGPPLMDDEWIYGSAAENIFLAIVEGRPQGMPAYGNRIPDYQVWQIVAYVRSLSGLSGDTAAQSMAREEQLERSSEVTEK